MMDTCKGNQAGFSLIEVLIAITLFAIGILGVAAMQTMATGGNTVAMTITELTTLASQQMEELKALPFNQLVDTNGDGADSAVGYGLGNDGDPAVVDPATGTGVANAGKADFEVQRGDIILSANVAPGLPMPLIGGGGGTTTIRVIATKLNANMDKVVRSVTLDSVSSIGSIH